MLLGEMTYASFFDIWGWCRLQVEGKQTHRNILLWSSPNTIS